MSNGFTKHNKNRDKNNEFVLHKSKLDSVPAENKKKYLCRTLKKLQQKLEKFCSSFFGKLVLLFSKAAAAFSRK